MIESIEVRRFRTRAEAEESALVLAAVGVASRVVPDADGVALCVPEGEAAYAHDQLAAFERENARRAQPTRGRIYAADRSIGPLLYGLLLLVFFTADRNNTFGIEWAAAGAMQAGAVMAGEWWRTVTALALHADLGHLLGNIGFGVVFGLVLAERLGPGVAWLGILLSGALGNALNAALQPPEHTAVGASTAIFGALGLLAGYSPGADARRWLKGLRRWAPVAAGLVLLVFLGLGGERTDVGAHLAGFAVGGAMGFALARPLRRSAAHRAAQLVSGALAGALFVLAWAVAVGSAPGAS